MGVMFTQQYTKTEPHTAEQSPPKNKQKNQKPTLVHYCVKVLSHPPTLGIAKTLSIFFLGHTLQNNLNADFLSREYFSATLTVNTKEI